MEIVHRISLRAGDGELADLAQLGVRLRLESVALPGAGHQFVAFEVLESDPLWPKVREWAARRDAGDFISTTFTEREIREASWLRFRTDWHHGYPQPDEGNAGYLTATYDLTDYCPQCGVGRRQKAPFQMKGEPQWGRKGVMQLNWVFDEYFVRPDVWTACFEPQGIRRRPVTDRRGTELQTVVQLVIEEQVSLDTTGLRSETCGRCGKIKYLPIVRGPLPQMIAEPSSLMAKTTQYFGSEGNAFQEVLAFQDVVRALESAKVRGTLVQPVAHEPLPDPAHASWRPLNTRGLST